MAATTNDVPQTQPTATSEDAVAAQSEQQQEQSGEEAAQMESM